MYLYIINERLEHSKHTDGQMWIMVLKKFQNFPGTF